MMFQYTWNFIQVASVLAIISFIPTARAVGPNSDSCCMQAYLLNRNRDKLPWDVCLQKFRNGTDPSPIVTATLGWCKQNCGAGFSLNTRLQWLTPLSTWIFPMLFLLANLPFGDLPRRFIKRWGILEYVNLFWPYIEWVSVLGDPASAFAAAYSTLAKDFIFSYSIMRYKLGVTPLKSLDKSLIGLAMVASRTRPEEYTLAAFIPHAFSNLITEYLTNPKVFPSDELREMLYIIRANFDSRNLKIAVDTDPARAMLDSLQHSDMKGETLRKELVVLQNLLETTPQPKLTVIEDWEEDSDSLYEDNTPPDLLKSLKDCNEIWSKVPAPVAAESSAPDEPEPSKPVTEESQAAESKEIERIPVQSESVYEAPPTFSGQPERVLPSTTVKNIVQAIMRSRDNIMLSVIFPMLIVFATLINTFSTAYRELGNEETAQGIAYGTWYMWILILTVSSNTTASSIRTRIVTDALRVGANIRPKQVIAESVMSRNGYANNANWFRWLEAAHVPKIFRIGIIAPGDSNFRFVRYMVWQFVGWVWVGFACANAAAVAFTTPTVGLGCRSLNHVMYGSGTFIAGQLRVFKRETFDKTRSTSGELEDMYNYTTKTARLRLAVGVLYHSICTINVITLSVGTIFQISGFYNNCKCEALFGNDDTMIQINSFTTHSRDNARQYWLSMAYVAYTTAWVACGFAICTRAFVFYILDREFGDDRPGTDEGEDAEQGDSPLGEYAKIFARFLVEKSQGGGEEN